MNIRKISRVAVCLSVSSYCLRCSRSRGLSHRSEFRSRSLARPTCTATSTLSITTRTNLTTADSRKSPHSSSECEKNSQTLSWSTPATQFRHHRSSHSTARKNNQPIDPMMLVMSSLKYDAMAVGNHEYNFGLKVLEKARKEAKFPWLSANTYDNQDRQDSLPAIHRCVKLPE